MVATVGAEITYTAYGEQGTEINQKPGSEATYTGEFTHQATVNRSNPVFPQGATLSNRSVYFSRLTPTLNGTFSYRYTASRDGNVTVDGTLTLIIASVDSESEDTTVEYWRDTQQLDQGTASLAPGESLNLTFSENVTEVANRSEQFDKMVGDTPGTIETKVVADIETDGTVNGKQIAREQQYTLGISPDGGIYRIADPGTVTNTTQQKRTVTVTKTPGPLRRLGGPALAVVGLSGLLVLGIGRFRGMLELDEHERAYLDYESARAEFEDWITRAQLPADALDGTVVPVESLEGLVDIAIDSNRRVIEDGDGEYVVTVEDLVYRYSAPPEPGSASWSSYERRGYELRTDDSREAWEKRTDEAENDADGPNDVTNTTQEGATDGTKN
ncbi:DUF5305 domain-containing protein [Halorientalis brevis]|uniref:DUF5305 domain-containing protein n=1 Tax=Halorientalis brevis TaxID=1126241 RepID=A0ABD6CCX9_9EURY|nr:DUF5305 domain-containing protein [Halorientalis brevis]